jgi:hypothetical protein
MCGPDGVTVLDGALVAPVPCEFTAATSKVYAVPLASPVTVAVVAVEAEWVKVVYDPPEEYEMT